jgi:TonB family protein
VDKSFQGLVLSLIAHAILVWLLFHAKVPNLMPQSETTEVEFIERDSKAKAFVTETEKKDQADINLKRTADYLSKFTKRVKKETRARASGETQNSLATPTLQPQSESRQASSGGNQSAETGEGSKGKLMGMGGAGLNPALHNVAIGQSSLAEYIPGVQEGAFTALNTDQFTYYTFFARVNEQVRPRWIHLVRGFISRQSVPALENLARLERRTLIEVIIDKDGEYIAGAVMNTSGERELDQTSVEAFRTAAPFPNPPRGLMEADGKIHLRYGFVVEFRPPSLGGTSAN